jgi:NRPS condensation-like uncharacterized protein
VPLKVLFENSTIDTLANQIQKFQADESAITALPLLTPVSRAQSLPLSFAQQRLWFFEQLEPNSSAYNMPGAIRLQGQLDLSALEMTLREIIRRHEALRTNFISQDGQAIVQIQEAGDIHLLLIDLSGISNQAEKIEALTAAEARKPFDLTHDPLIRLNLIKIASTEHILLLTMHHIVSDGWSLGILMKEIAILYEAFVADELSPLQS